MSDIKISRGYELQYWIDHKKDRYDRGKKILSLFPVDIKDSEIVCDVGCGPRCGIFSCRQFSKMYAVDPLWSDYKKTSISVIPKGVEIVEAYADDFKLPVKCDTIISANALDHSGSLRKSILNIMSNLSLNGTFGMHLHLRSKSQLNKGHKMLITEKDVDEIFKDFVISYKKIYDVCPLDEKPYRTYTCLARLR